MNSPFLPALAVALLASASAASAAPSGTDSPRPTASVVVGHSPEALTITASANAKGEVTLRAENVHAQLPLRSVESLEASEVALAGGAKVAIVRVSGGGQLAAAVVSRNKSGRAVIPWTGALDPRGDPGERSGDMIEVGDRNGDGIDDVIVGHFDERARLCGQDRTLLGPRAIDPVTLRLRPVVLSRQGQAPEGTPRLEASVQSPGPTGPPLVKQLRARATSDRADELGSRLPPAALTDGDPATYWAVFGAGDAGRGEFVTFSRDGAGSAVHAIALTLLPLKPAEGLARPSRLWLIGDQGARIEVSIPASAYTNPGARIWIKLPSPLPWRCLSIVFDQHHAAAGGKPPQRSALAEVEVYTELDFEGGLDRIVDRLASDGRGATDAARLLVAMGPDALPALATAWPRLSSTARVRALGVAAPLAPTEDAARALVASALEDDGAAVREEAVKVATEAMPATRDLLAKRAATADATGDAAALALAKAAPAEATPVLLAAIAADRGSERAALRSALGVALRGGGGPVLGAINTWSTGGDAAISARAAVTLAMAKAADVADVAAAASTLLEASAPSATKFEDLWRLVSATRALVASPTVDAWLAELASSKQPWMLRAAAVQALAARKAPQATQVATTAAHDEYPRVRAAAIATLAGSAQDAGLVLQLAKTDPWPLVRVRALDTLGAGPAAGRVLDAALADRSHRVRAAAIRGLTRAKRRDAWEAIKERLDDEHEDPAVKEEALTFVSELCVLQAHGPLVEIVQKGMAPNATSSGSDLALQAMATLGALGGKSRATAVRLAKLPIAPQGFKDVAKRASAQPSRCDTRL